MTRVPLITGDVWFNLPAGMQAPDPFPPEQLSGKVVLVDFWTYSCVNCLRTLPYLKEWWKKYGERDDFIIIGVHAYEFDFEKEPANVERAIKELGITWPVVLDNDRTVWNAFANRYWPAKYLIDKGGHIIYQHFGEGNYGETEREIRAALGIEEEMSGAPDEHEHGSVCFVPTPETYCGYERGEIANIEGFREEDIYEYQKPREIPDGVIGLEGKFLARPEYVESREKGATLYLSFHGTEVNLVLHTSAGNEAEIRLFVNDREITADIAGKDVEGQGRVMVSEARLYNLIRANTEVKGSLALQAVQGNFQAYAFTFSGCEHQTA